MQIADSLEDFDSPKLPLELALSPSGQLHLCTDTEERLDPSLSTHLQRLFESPHPEDRRIGLLRLGVLSLQGLPPSFLFWHSFVHLFIVKARHASGQTEGLIDNSFDLPPPIEELSSFLDRAPFMRGEEYLTLETLTTLWQDLCSALKTEVIPFSENLHDYLTTYNPSWAKVSRVYFHLAENKTDADYPFAFLATYTTQLSSSSSVHHLPLGQALRESAEEKNRSQLLSLLVPVQKAAEKSPFIHTLVETKALFNPLAWRAQDAHAFLKAIPLIEEAGVMVRVPNWWTPKNPPRPQITIAVGNAQASSVGFKALLDFNRTFSLPNGEEISDSDWQTLMASQDSLVQIKGQWVEVDQEKITAVLSHWKSVERQVKKDGLSFAEGLRLLASAPGQKETNTTPEEIRNWSQVVEGAWLEETLKALRHPSSEQEVFLQTILQTHLKTALRPYQSLGVQWLWALYTLKLGGCLADDMGLGKTIQVLSLLLLAKNNTSQGNRFPHLLILPASLLGNWQKEIERFAPSLTIWIAHSSVMKEDLKGQYTPSLDVDVVITTYGNVYRLSWIRQVSWGMVILDEAQNIKNPTTKQTQAIKTLSSQVRFILTGTPVENRLLDLWSLFDFIAPGLLGTSRTFSNYGKKAVQQEGESHFYSAVRRLVAPYILRRLKTDKTIISDLPDKTEVEAYCFLTKQQAALYQKTVEELAKKLTEDTFDDIMKKKGLVMASILRLKQICNHPHQWLGHGQYDPSLSGKFIRLQELCASIAAKQEKVLIFTQFTEIIPALEESLRSVFGQPGLTLHGQTAIKDRMKHVDAFQEDQGPPFFVLSLKAGGTGLTLTKASHVIHFDRWWNPAVENQATDRAYRIGQKKAVLVHKFICQGTIEEKIDAMIRSKKSLAEDLLTQEEAIALTDFSTSDLLNTLTLDIHRALGDS